MSLPGATFISICLLIPTQDITPWSLWLKPLGTPHFLPTEPRVLSQCFLITWLNSCSLIHRTQKWGKYHAHLLCPGCPHTVPPPFVGINSDVLLKYCFPIWAIWTCLEGKCFMASHLLWYTTLGSSISRVLLSQADDKPNAQLGAYVCFTFLLWGSHSCPSKGLMRLGGLCKATSIGRWWVRIQSQIETQNLWWTLCGQCWCATQRPTQRKPIFILLTLREVLCQPRSALVIHVTEQ